MALCLSASVPCSLGILLQGTMHIPTKPSVPARYRWNTVNTSIVFTTSSFISGACLQSEEWRCKITICKSGEGRGFFSVPHPTINGNTVYYAYLHNIIIIVSLLPHIIIDYIVTYSFISSTCELVMEFLVLWDTLGNIHRGISDTCT